jgi:hypothetical protein
MPPWLVFLLSFAAFHALWEGVRPSDLGRSWVEGVLVPASAQLVQWAQPHWQVQARGRKLQSALGGVTVQRGCEGMEFVALGWAALLAASRHRPSAPLPQRQPLPGSSMEEVASPLPGPLVRQGLAWGWLLVTTGVVALSILRLASLMWCRVAQPEALGLWHGLLTPVLMVLGTAALCAPWLRPARA